MVDYIFLIIFVIILIIRKKLKNKVKYILVLLLTIVYFCITDYTDIKLKITFYLIIRMINFLIIACLLHSIYLYNKQTSSFNFINILIALLFSFILNRDVFIDITNSYKILLENVSQNGMFFIANITIISIIEEYLFRIIPSDLLIFKDSEKIQFRRYPVYKNMNSLIYGKIFLYSIIFGILHAPSSFLILLNHTIFSIFQFIIYIATGQIWILFINHILYNLTRIY